MKREWETPDLEAVVKRLEKVESQNRRLKWAGGLVLVVLCAVVLMGQASPKKRIVEAEQFILRDVDGNMRAFLSLVEDSPSLVLHDKHGNPVVLLGVFQDGSPSLAFFDKQHNPCAVLSVSDGSPSLTLRDKDGKIRAKLSLFDDGSPSLALRDKDGKTRAELSTFGDGLPLLVLYDRHGKSRASLGVREDGTSGIEAEGFILRDTHGRGRVLLGVMKGKWGLYLFDLEEKLRASLLVGEEDRTWVSALSLVADGETRGMFGIVNGRPQLAILDREGKVIFRAP